MKKNLIIAFIAITLMFSVSISAAEYEKGEEGYTKMRAELGKLFREKKYKDGITLLKKHYNKYPDHLTAMSFNLAALYKMEKEYEKGIKVMLNAQKKGCMVFDLGAAMVIFSKSSENSNHLRRYWPTIKNFMQRQRQRQNHSSRSGNLKILILKKAYPLFIALHGGDGNIKGFRPQWDSEKLKEEFIVLFVQSSQMSSTNGYHWTDPERTYNDVKDAFDKTSAKYKIDKNKILIGGFSSGGEASLHLSFNTDIPIKGFVILCPALPETINEKNIAEAVRERGFRNNSYH